tara:strand:+ start:939 stop:1163 length:225 start_codon:yes stop_codon:yes gene_type:complete
MALKKNTQCNETKIPQNNNLKKSDFEIINFFFNNGNIINRHITAINILYQTKFNELIEINEPRIAVNPKIKTIK